MHHAPRPALLVPLLAVLLLAACSSTREVRVGADGFLLATRPTEAGGEAAYRLQPGDGAGPRVHRTTTSTWRASRLGVVARTVTGELGRELGVEPWRGVLLEGVTPGGPAARGGLVRGDVVLAIGGEELASQEQFGELLDARVPPEEPVEVRVARASTPGADRRELVLEVVPAAREVSESRSDAFGLPSSAGVQRLTGVQLAEIAGELATEIYGSPEPVVLVAGVVTGSPGYFAGLRGGDRVLACDGAPVTTVADVRGPVLAHAAARGITPGEVDADEAALRDSSAVEARPGPVELSVAGPLGAHRASVAVRDDLQESTRVHVPILFDYERDVRTKRVGFLDFIVQLGFTYDRTWLASGSRAPARHSELSLLPFGMFEVERGPRHDRYRLFWLVSFRTRK